MSIEPRRFSLQRQGGSKFTYSHGRGYHPLVSIVANAGRGAASFVTESVTRARAAGATTSPSALDVQPWLLHREVFPSRLVALR